MHQLSWVPRCLILLKAGAVLAMRRVQASSQGPNPRPVRAMPRAFGEGCLKAVPGVVPGGSLPGAGARIASCVGLQLKEESFYKAAAAEGSVAAGMGAWQAEPANRLCTQGVNPA